VRYRIATLPILALAAASFPSAAPAAKHERCSMKGSRTVLATRTARIFRTNTGELVRDRIYGCLYSRGRRVRLGFRDCFDQRAAENLAVAGRYAGYSLETCNRGSGTASVAVTDLATGRRIEEYEVAQTHVFQSVSDLVVTRRGSVAWIEWSADQDARPVRRIAVRKWEGRGVVTLDEGLDVVRGSLARGRSGNLYWLRAATPRTATLR
jgi:hypothetical protein